MLCIIADDLTGALDAAAPFAGRGLSVVVALAHGALARAVALAPDVVAFSTQSRDVSEAVAVARLAEVAKQLPVGARIFKKVDSRLKGHIAAELTALTPGALFVAPAIPDFGRVVRSGAVTGFGVEAPIPVAKVLGDLATRATVPDTETSRDMAMALKAAPAGALLVGARGLAEALAVQITGRAQAVAPRPIVSRALMVVGSRDPITVAQVEALRKEGVDWRPAPNGQLAVAQAPSSQGLTLVQAVQGGAVASGDEVALRLGASVHPALTDGIDTIFLTGGATAEAVLAQMELELLHLDGEVLPGVPMGRGERVTVILKSGGFGGGDTLIRLAALLRRGA